MPGRGRGSGGAQPRSVLVSKALSRLLRHAAVQERIPIDNRGYIRMDHLLQWQRLRSMKPPVNFAEVVDVVNDNEKKRFALKFVPAESETEFGGEDGHDMDNGKGKDIEASSNLPEPESDHQQETDTQRAITIFQSTPPSDLVTKRFFIRATQGHSLKTIVAENLLTPISLDDPATVPQTVVHGTFYGAWEGILSSGGLKSMSRNHVHFAAGPALDKVLPVADVLRLSDKYANGTVTDTKDSQREHQSSSMNLSSLLTKNKVISGMRSDAQILVYIDIHRALTEEKDMKWWRSENGVVLTDGISPSGSSSAPDGEGNGKKADGADKIVPSKYFLAAVEIKEGVGLLFEAEKGIVKELPERLRGRGVPRGKGGGPRGRGPRRGR